jgi:hypothetical protein
MAFWERQRLALAYFSLANIAKEGIVFINCCVVRFVTVMHGLLMSAQARFCASRLTVLL